MKEDILIELTKDEEFDDLLVTSKTEANSQTFSGILFIIKIYLYG